MYPVIIDLHRIASNHQGWLLLAFFSAKRDRRGAEEKDPILKSIFDNAGGSARFLYTN